MSTIHCSHKDIVNYWYGKYIMPDGRIGTGSNGGGIPVLIDKNELNCWACDRLVNEATELERCHILAESLGGEGYADNLFLLCKDCHRQSPDTTNREAFFRWVYKKRKKYAWGVPNSSYIQKLIDDELSDRGMMSFSDLFKTLPKHKQDKLTEMLTFKTNDIISNSDIYQYIFKHTTVHFGEKCATLESMIITIVDYILKCYYELIMLDYLSV